MFRSDLAPAPFDLDECVESWDGECEGEVRHHQSPSGSGMAYPRCDAHWYALLDTMQAINERYPVNPPSDWSPLDAGEAWGEEDY